MRTRYFLTAASLALGLAACDKEPFDNSTASAEETQLAQTAGQATFGNLIAALNNINVQIDELDALNNLTVVALNDLTVTVVNVENVLNGNNVRAFNNALNENNVQILQDFLNESLNDNVVNILNNAFNDLDLTLNDVIAVNVLSGGDVILFAQ